MNNSLNEAVEAVDGNSLLLDAAVAVGEGSGDAGIGDQNLVAILEAQQTKDGRQIQPFSAANNTIAGGAVGVEGGASSTSLTRGQQKPPCGLLSHSPTGLMVAVGSGKAGQGADIGADPQAVSIGGMSESSSQTSLESVEMLNRKGRLGQSQTFGNNALQRRLSQSKKEKYEVYMRCVTWSRDSHGLFDYESRYISKKNIKTGQSGRIVRLNNDVEFISMDMRPEDLHPSAKPLMTITQNARGKFVIKNDSGNSGQSETSRQRRRANNNAQQDDQQESTNNAANMMFVVVRNLKSQKPPEIPDQNGQQLNSFLHDFRLQRGNIIKLGRLKFSVKDFRTDQQPANCDLKRRGVIDRSASPVKQRYRVAASKTGADGSSVCDEDDSENEFNAEEAVEIDCGVVQQQDGCEVQCKVCWSSEQTRNNPLLNSCKCDGSVRFIHYECLKFWLKQKMAVKEEPNQVSYMWKQFECEICKTPYPYVFKSNGNRFRLVDVEIPKEKNFLWLESLTFEKNSSRMVHVVMPDRDHTQFKMGRGHESDLRVSDISVSRCHAILKYDIDRTHSYYLEDNLSKFGTLVLSEHPIELEVDETQAVQIGRSVISFTVKPVIESPAAALGATITEEEVPRAIYNQPVPTQLLGHPSSSSPFGTAAGRVTSSPLAEQHHNNGRSPPQVLESVGLYSTSQLQQQQQNATGSHTSAVYMPPGGTVYRQNQQHQQQRQQQLQSQTTGSFEEQKNLLRTPSPVRRGNQASMLLSASNQQTAYRPHQYGRNETSNPRMPGAGVLLDHHSTTFTPLGASNTSQRRSTAQRLMQQPSHHLNTIQQQNQSDSDEINNCSDDRNSNSNDIDADNDAMMESDPDAAAELLRQKIEETNQKISDYFRQQQRLAAAQQQMQQQSQQQQHKSSSILPQRLDFYNHGQQQPAGGYFQQQQDEVKEDYEAIKCGNSGKNNRRQQPRVPNLDLQASGLSSSGGAANPTNANTDSNNATESLNQTLKRFQSMIQQVEQRFAEREKINCTSPPMQGLEPSEMLKERNSLQFQQGSPVRQAPKRNLNDYDIAKQQIEEKQQLLNSQYSLHPQTITQSAPRYGHHCAHHDNNTQPHQQQQNQLSQSEYASPHSHHHNQHHHDTAAVSRQNLLDALNRAVSVQHPPSTQLSQQYFQQESPKRQQYLAHQYNLHHHQQQQHDIGAPRHYELSRERSIQQVIQKSPTKMYQHQADCISPNRRQQLYPDNNDAPNVSYSQLHNNHDSSSFRSGSDRQYVELQQQQSLVARQNQHHDNGNLSRLSLELQQQRSSSDNLAPQQQSSYQYQMQQQVNPSRHEDLLTKISDTIRQSEAHKASVNERLQKAKSMAVETPTPDYNLIGGGLNNSHYSRQQSSQFGANKKSSSTVQTRYPHQQNNSAIKHTQSFSHHNHQGPAARRSTETKNHQQRNQQQMMMSRYDVDYFGAPSDINISSNVAAANQSSPVRGARVSTGGPADSRNHHHHQNLSNNKRQSQYAPQQQSYSMLAASGSNKVNKAGASRGRDNAHGGRMMNQTVVHHDHDYSRRQQQSSPVHQHKRQSHQASPIKMTGNNNHTTTNKRPQSAYKSPMRQQSSSHHNTAGGYSGKHSQLPSYSYQRQHQHQAPGGYSAGGHVGNTSNSRYSAALQKQSSSFYEQQQSRGVQGPSSSYMQSSYMHK